VLSINLCSEPIRLTERLRTDRRCKTQRVADSLRAKDGLFSEKEEEKMLHKHKLLLILALAAVLSLALPLTIALAQCPEDAEIYVGGEVTDATAVRGSEANPADDMNEAFDICGECEEGGVIRFRYDADQDRYLRRTSCGFTTIPDSGGAPLAQPVLTLLLGLLAVGLLVWGIYMRRQLKRL
jgi:hypothetical protein